MLFPTDLRCDPGDIERRGIGIDLGHRQVFAADGTWRKIPRHRIVSRVGIMASLYFECGCDVEKPAPPSRVCRSISACVPTR